MPAQHIMNGILGSKGTSDCAEAQRKSKKAKYGQHYPFAFLIYEVNRTFFKYASDLSVFCCCLSLFFNTGNTEIRFERPLVSLE